MIPNAGSAHLWTHGPEITRQLTAIMPGAPQLALTVATDSPILDGATLMSLGIARDRVFTT